MGGQTAITARPTHLIKIGEGTAAASAFIAGMKLGVFSALSVGPKPADQVASEIEVDPVRLRILMYALASTGLLTVSEGRFSNSTEAQRFYVNSSAEYVGPVHEHLPQRWMEDLQTAESVRTGCPGSRLDWARSSDAVRRALQRMFAGACASGQALAREFDLSRIESLADIGGGAGGVALGIAGSCPGIHATVVDLPGATRVARESIERARLAHRVTVLSWDVLGGAVPGQYDAAVARYFFQVLGREQVRQAMKNVAACIKPGGTLFILGDILRNSRTAPRPAALVFGLSAINRLDHGQAYTESEYRLWLREAGLTDCSVSFGFMPEGAALIVACKRPHVPVTNKASRMGGRERRGE